MTISINMDPFKGISQLDSHPQTDTEKQQRLDIINAVMELRSSTVRIIGDDSKFVAMKVQAVEGNPRCGFSVTIAVKLDGKPHQFTTLVDSNGFQVAGILERFLTNKAFADVAKQLKLDSFALDLGNDLFSGK